MFEMVKALAGELSGIVLLFVSLGALNDHPPLAHRITLVFALAVAILAIYDGVTRIIDRLED